jgi:hypothetical protein
MAWQVLIALATLFAALLLAGAALAHNVTEGDAGYVQEVTGFRPIAFIYLGAKHRVTGYDHLLFLAGVIFFLYRTKDTVTYVSIFAIGHSVTTVAGVWWSRRAATGKRRSASVPVEKTGSFHAQARGSFPFSRPTPSCPAPVRPQDGLRPPCSAFRNAWAFRR